MTQWIKLIRKKIEDLVECVIDSEIFDVVFAFIQWGKELILDPPGIGFCWACEKRFDRHAEWCPIPFMGCSICDTWRDAHLNKDHEFVSKKIPEINQKAMEKRGQSELCWED